MAAIPDFNVPSGGVAQVKIIDTTSRISKIPTTLIYKPDVEGYEYINDGPCWSFLVESPSGKKVLFDLGTPKDFADLAPVVVNMSKQVALEITVEKNTAEILEGHGVALSDIGSIIWSHWHWDHIGDPSTFPSSTDLVVGPGFKAAFLPGYPAKEDSPVREKDFKGRNLVELDFETDSTVQLGRMKAIDYFGDGSFYLLDTPGHAIGHLGGLARTTSNPDTFMFMGGDLCHHGGEMRPSKYLPIPAEITPHPWIQQSKTPCPGALFEKLQTTRSRKVSEPFYEPAIYDDYDTVMETIRRAQEADAKDNVLFIYAHDSSLYGEVDLFPKSANDWKQKGWRQKLLWAFLKDFQKAVEKQ